MLTPPPIPVILTKANWDKEKGVIAKMAGETGIGEAMKQMAIAYGAVDWAKFDAKKQLNAVKQMSVIDAAADASVNEYKTKVEKLREKVKELRDLATKTEADFKKKPLIPSSSTKHVGKVANEADIFWITLKGNSQFFTDSQKTFEDDRKALQVKIDLANKVIAGYIKSLSNDAKDVISTPTVEQYKGEATKGFHQGVRGLSAALKLQTAPKLQKFQSEWNDFVVDSYLPKKDEDVKPKVIEVITKLKELQKLL